MYYVSLNNNRFTIASSYYRDKKVVGYIQF